MAHAHARTQELTHVLFFILPELLFLVLPAPSALQSVWSNASSKLSDGLRSDSTRSLTESEKRSRREKAARMLGTVKKGASVAWAKVTSDHPEPLPIDKVRTREKGEGSESMWYTVKQPTKQ